MSRIGRKPIPLPAGVKIAMQPDRIDVQGPKGKLTVPVPHGISFEQKDGVLNALRMRRLPDPTPASSTEGLALG